MEKSEQNLKEFSKKRILSDMIDGSKTTAREKAGAAAMLILIIEDYTLNIIDSLLAMSDLTSNGIFAVERLELKRKPFPSAHAIYFLEPSIISVDRMDDDFQQGLYSHAHIYFTKVIPEDVMTHFKTKKALLKKILSLKELNIDFTVVDDTSFTLTLPGMLNQLYYNENNLSVLNHAAEKLYCALSVLMPLSSMEVAFQRTDNCTAVAKRIGVKLQGALKNKDSPLDTEAGSIKLIILERSYDVATPLTHDFYYQSLVSDLLNIDYRNEIEYESESAQGKKETKRAYLTEKDKVWRNFRYKHMADTLNGLSNDFNELVKNNSTAQVHKGQKVNLDVKEMQKIVRSIPEYAFTIDRYVLHMHLLDLCMKQFHAKNLKELGDIEQTVTTGVDGSGAKPSSTAIFNLVKTVMNSHPNLGEDDRLRLALLTSIKLKLTKASREQLKMYLESSESTRALTSLGYMGVDLSEPNKPTKSNISDKEKAAAKQRLKDAEFDLCRYTLPLEKILDDFVANTLDSSKFESFLIPAGSKQNRALGSDLTAFRLNKISKGKQESKSKVVLFILGGISYPEVRILKQKGINSSRYLRYLSLSIFLFG